MSQTTTRRHAIYAAIAQYGNGDAGHICYGRTKDEARDKARARTTMSIIVRRERATQDQIAALEAVGKL